jgi:putative membrane protein insertion efficiency factor
MRPAFRLIIQGPIRGLIRGYQVFVSPWLGPRCRFHPSCSNYALQALDQHGVVRGSMLALARIGRCHPWHPGGLDPVPKK